MLAGVLAVTVATGMAEAQNSGAGSGAPAAASAEADDPHVWLEEIEGERALAWARAENARTLTELQGDPRYHGFYGRALEILQAQDRIPYVAMRPSGLYNFWQDETHVRGILRRTRLDSYRSDAPAWETVLDIDVLGAAEDRNWVYRGSLCPTGAGTRRWCASSTWSKGVSWRAASICPTASRASPGSMPTPCWSPANGDRGR
jgi:prolyl oligopeptidase